MVKHLASKRTDKSLTVEDYWEIRESLKTKKHVSRAINPNIEEKIHSQFRYQRQKNLVKQFNPLAVLLQDRITPEETHTQLVLGDLTNLPKPISKVRGMCLTLPLMLHNLPLIVKLLTDNLQIEDSWKLLEAVLRDTGVEAFEVLLPNVGKLVKNVGQGFDNSLFKRIFTVLAILLESSFEKFRKHLQRAWTAFRSALFQHENKYVRRFSVECFAYVLNRLPKSERYSFYDSMIVEGEDPIRVAWAMFYQLRPVGGFLTHIAAERLAELWDHLFDGYLSLAATPTQTSEEASTVLRERQLSCLTCLLSHMSDRLSIQPNQAGDMMLDLCDMLRIVTEKSFKALKQQRNLADLLPVINCLDHTLSTNKYARSQPNFMECLGRLLKETLKNRYQQGSETTQFARLIAAYICANKQQASKDNYYAYLCATSREGRAAFMSALIEESEREGRKYHLRQEVVSLLMLVSKPEIEEFLREEQVSEELLLTTYQLCLVLKQSNFPERLDLHNLSVDPTDLREKLKRWAQNVQKDDFTQLFRLLTSVKLLKHVSLQCKEAAAFRQILNILNSYCNDVLENLFAVKLPSDDEGSFFDLNRFIKRLCANNSQLVPAVDFVLDFKEISSQFAHSHSLEPIEESSALAWLYTSRSTLLYSTSFAPQFLSSRVRSVRLHHLSSVEQPSQLVSILLAIDQEEVDLQTEREVKRLLSTIPVRQLTKQDALVLVNWCMGFAYTGFKLIEEPFVKLLSQLLGVHQEIICSVVLEELKYMNMKMSRKFAEALSGFLESSMQPLDEFCNQNGLLVQLLQEEYPLINQDTAESIGFQRVAMALQLSEAGRNYLSTQLNELLQAYFKYEFRRRQRFLDRLAVTKEEVSPETIQNKLLPPHPLHLALIMKILPSGYLPPYEVLHFDSFLSTFEKLGIKTVPWETIWQKKTDEQTHISLTGRLSKEEQRLYMHFLWKLVLEGDEAKRQKVFEHLRAEFPDLEISYLLKMNFSQIDLKLEQVYPSVINQASGKLRLVGQKPLIAFLRTTSSLLQIFKMSVQQWVPAIAQLLVLITQQVEDREETASTKLLRRTCGKTLVSLYREFGMFPELILPSAEVLLGFVSEHLQKIQAGSISAVPTLLRVLLEWSAIPQLKQLFQQRDLLLGLSKIYSQSSTKESVLVMSQLLLNLYGSSAVELANLDQALRSVSLMVLQNFAVYFGKQAIPSIGIIALLKEIISRADSVPSSIALHAVSAATALLGKSRKNQEKYRENIAGLLELLADIAGKSPLDEHSAAEVMQLLPQADSELKQLLLAILAVDQTSLSREVHDLASGLNSTKQMGLEVLPDYDRIFSSLRRVGERLAHYTNLQKEYILLNLITMVANEELSVKSAAVEKIEQWLGTLTLEDLPQFKTLYRVVLQLLKIHARDEQKFLGCIAVAGMFLQCLHRLHFTGISYRDTLHTKLGLCETQPDKNFFKLITSIVQSSKLRAVNMLKANFEKLRKQDLDIPEEIRHDLPSTLTRVLLPLLEQLISSKSKGNLSSSLSLACIKLEGQLFALLTASEMKQELKRLAMRLDFKDTHSKNNVLMMKLLNEILDSVQIGKSVLPVLEAQIKSTGMEILNYQRENHELEEEDEEAEELEQVNQKYIRLDRKMIAAEEEQEEVDPLVSFMRKCLLVPLKAMLFYESRSNTDESKQSTSRLFLTVVLTKLLLRFPLPVFLIEFNKIVSKLSRMLKKKSKEVRDNARKCLSQIVRLTGAPLLHIVIRQMAFQLNQNFEKHIFTYSVHFIVNELADQPHVLDYCLPLVLPCCYEDIFGQSAAQKELVDDNQIPTTMFEVKKRKGLELLTLAAKLISPEKVEHLIQSLKGELRKQLISQDRLSKFEAVIANVVSGLSKNQGISSPQHILPLLDRFIKESSQRLRLFELNEDLNETTVRTELKKQRAVTKEEVLTLQPETARSGSIFRKVNRDVMLKRNTDQFSSCLSNLHLSLVLMALKRGLLTEQIFSEYAEQTNRIVLFVVSCLDHTSNTVLGKALRITAELLKWSSASLLVTYREAIAKKVLKNLDRLTSGQKELARECFTVVNLVLRQTTVPFKYVGPLLSHVRVHMEEDTKESYELLKTLLLKHTKHPDIPPVLEQVRQNMVSTYRDDIRKASKSVYCCYLRECQGQKQKEAEFMFLLKNVDYAEPLGKQAVLESLQELLAKFTQTELEHYAEILFMSLLAAYSVEQQTELRTRFELIEHNLLKSVNKAKVQMILQQGLCWAKDEDQAIRLNGLNTFLLVHPIFPISQAQAQLLSPVVKEVVLQATSQLKCYFDDVKQRLNQKARLRNESSWSNIISTMVEEPRIVDRPVCLVASLKLGQKIPSLQKDDEFVEAICSLCCHPCKEEHLAAISLAQHICKVNFVGVVAHLPTYFRQFSDSFTELKQHEAQKFVIELIYQGWDQAQHEFVRDLLIMLRRAVHHASVQSFLTQKKADKNEKTLEYLSHLHLKLLEDSQAANLLGDSDCRTIMVQTANKLTNQKEYISEAPYEEIEKFVDALKQTITAQSYFELTSTFKAARLEKTQAKKAAHLQLAITDHSQYQREKRSSKKVKRK